MPLCSDANIKVDFVIPTRDKPNDALIHVLEHMPCTGQIIITRERPLSIARKRAVLRAKTEWVAMVDDDMVLPKDWLQRWLRRRLRTLARLLWLCRETSVWLRMIGSLVRNEVKQGRKSPRINNVLLRHSLIAIMIPRRCFLAKIAT
jgi:glycosyltransferase involved in cell wall biosynthesis